MEELTENIAILYNLEILEQVKTKEGLYPQDLLVEGNTITETIEFLATSKSKDYASLSNKAIFKYMDLVDM